MLRFFLHAKALFHDMPSFRSFITLFNFLITATSYFVVMRSTYVSATQCNLPFSVFILSKKNNMSIRHTAQFFNMESYISHKLSRKHLLHFFV